MKDKRIAALIFFAASILTLSVSFSQFLKPGLLYSPNEPWLERKETRSLNETETFISLPAFSISSFSLPAPFNIQSHLPCCFLFEIFTDAEDDDDVYTEKASLYPDVFFEITFRLIISPNAP